MTPEQIDLEFEHIAIDKALADKASGKNVYVDDGYEDYDKETEEVDSKLSDMPKFTSEVDPYVGMVKSQEQNEDDWEDVETDVF
jgi:hypothetical protein